MCWEYNIENYKCKDCANEFEFEMDTLYIAFNGSLKCPKCGGNKIEKLPNTNENSMLQEMNRQKDLFKNRKKRSDL